MCVNQNEPSLSSSLNGQISWCKNCNHFSVIYKTTCMLFRKNDLKSFVGLLQSLQPEDFKYDFVHGSQVILKNNCSSVGLSLTMGETKELINLLSEAMLIYDAKQLITQGN